MLDPVVSGRDDAEPTPTVTFGADARRTDDVSPELALVCPELRAALIDALPQRAPDAWRPVRDEAAPLAPAEPPEAGEAHEPDGARPRARALLAAGAAFVHWALVGLGVAVVATSALTALARTPEPRLGPGGAGARPAAVAAPLVAWDEKQGALGYEVEVRRRGVLVLRLVRRTPDFRLPARWMYEGQAWALEAGAYQYVVRARTGAAGDDPVVARGALTAVPSP
jgi:hypothetical protein